MKTRRSFFKTLAGAAIAVTAAGRMTFQPELKPPTCGLEEVLLQIQQQVSEVWTERLRMAYQRAAADRRVTI